MISESEEIIWKQMTGKWYSSQKTKTGGKKEFISERYGDGTYKDQFRIHSVDGGFQDSIEVGHWGISGHIYFVSFRGWIEGNMIEHSDPTDPYNYDAYEIININKDSFEYQTIVSKDRFKVHRVSNDFNFSE